jgi:GT2 family glycosyltransferase
VKKLGIIIPYRDREEHLKKFIPHMINFLKNKLLYSILVIEQANNLPFNRAKLLNIGFDQLKDSCDYFCFHDIDMLPISKECDYSEINGVCKLSYYVSQFNFVPRPPDELGGVTLIDKDSFLSVNGYRNDYFGWGLEDNDFALRCKTKSIPFNIRIGKYMSLYHKPNGDTHGDPPSKETTQNRIKYQNILNSQNQLFLNGYSELNYKVLNVEEKEDFTLIKVDI